MSTPLARRVVQTFQGRGSFVLAVPQPSTSSLETSAIRTHRDVDMVDFRIGVESEAAALAAEPATGSTSTCSTPWVR